MASPGGGLRESLPADNGRPHYIEISSDSGDSPGEDASSEPYGNSCPWRTAEYHNQECSHYFDCPSHQVERVVSDEEVEVQEGTEASPGGQRLVIPPSQEDGRSHEYRQGPALQNSPSPTSVDLGFRHVQTDPPQNLPESSPGPARYQAPPHEASAASPAPVDDHNTTGTTGTTGTTDTVGTIGNAFRVSSSPPHSPVSEAPRPPGNTTANPRPGSTSVNAIDLTMGDSPSPPRIRRSPISRRHPRPSIDQWPSSGHRSSEGRRDSQVALPRWQPDAEVTLCPICRTQFSFFVRKHHCRKCGRVVCNACSPHRITIPYQYIVQPPDQPRLSAQRYPTSFIGGEDFGDISGGERVRLCNPCVPDPNTAPPQPGGSPSQISPRASHVRSHSNMGSSFGGNPSAGRFQGYFPVNPAHDAFGRHRSVTHSSSGLGEPSASSSRTSFPSTHGRILAGTPPTYYPSHAVYLESSRGNHRSLMGAGASSSSSAQNRALPALPPAQIAEEDECPICHRELPSRTLPNFETLRESHINMCIANHSANAGGGPSSTGAATDDDSNNEGGTPPPFATRRTGMFPYVATEKDCVDSAECTICLEEFEVGVHMARLECLCRFHRSCISAWFVNHPGRCPVHQHDAFGY